MRRAGEHPAYLGWPCRMRFPRSKLYASVIPILGLAFFVGFAGAVLGIGGGFIMVPALLYLFRVPTGDRRRHLAVPDPLDDASPRPCCTRSSTRPSTSCSRIILIVGGVFGAQFGARAGRNLRAELFRFLLALLLLAVGLRFAIELVLRPARAVLAADRGDAAVRRARSLALRAALARGRARAAPRRWSPRSRPRASRSPRTTPAPRSWCSARSSATRRRVARAGAYDIVVTVRGPRQTLVVREKEPLGPVWINQEQQHFPDAPAYLGVLSSRPVEEITTRSLRPRLRIGLAAIVNAPDFTADRGGRRRAVPRGAAAPEAARAASTSRTRAA